MNYSNKITGTTYGKITKKIIAKKSEKDTDYYIFYIQKTSSENSVNYYPFWWFVPKDFQKTHHKSAAEVMTSLVHTIVRVSYEQLPSNDGYIINSINRIDVAQKNEQTQETEFVNVINNFKNWQKGKEKTEEKVAENDFGTPLNPENLIEENTIESSIDNQFDEELSL